MDVEKTMELILSTQARVELSIQELKSVARGHQERLANLATSMATATDLIGREAQAAGMKELREAHASTDYKLNALIDTVGKIVRKNGHDQRPS